jgi:hypothetical protein
MKLRNIPEILRFLPAGVNLDADINEPAVPIRPPSDFECLNNNIPLIPVLHWACQHNHNALLRQLIAKREQYGLDINAQDPNDNNNTALSVANTCSVMQTLVEAGADLTIEIRGLSASGSSLLCSVLPVDRFLPATSIFIPRIGARMTHNDEFELIKGVLAAVYERYFYRQNQTKLAILLDTALGSAVGSIVAQYIVDLSLITKRLGYDLENFALDCEAAYNKCSLDKCLQDLDAALGKGGLEKLATLLNQPASSTCPEQNTPPVVLHFGGPPRQITVTTVANSSSSSSSSSSSASANGNPSASLSSSSSSSRGSSNANGNQRGINHPRWGKR